jgi:predicted phage terminase large subunit-like protein
VDSLQSIVQFSNGAGGWRLSTTPGSEATGFHPDCQIVDDPIKPQDARDVRAGETRAKLDAVGDWWSGTMSTRARDRATLVRVIIMQRVHDVDLAGRMMAEGGWEHLVLPMEYDPKIFWHLYPDREAAGGSPHCETALGRPDPRREVGGLLDPARFPQAEVDALRVELADAASAQLDQNPVTPGGGIFKEDYFRRRWTLRPVKNEPDRRQLPSGLILFSSWDLRFKDDAERGSYVVGEVWGYTPGTPDLYLVHQVRGRWGFAETEDEFLQVAQGWPMCLTHLVENKANGPALKSSMARKAYEAGLQEPEIELVDAMGSKILRANVAEPTWRAGRVWLPEDADWVPEFVREHVRFPRYKSDDQVDAASQAIAWARTSEGARVGDYLAGVREAARGMRP